MIYSFICTRPFDQIIGSSFIYYFFSAPPFDQKLESSLIYIFHLHTSIRQKYMIFFISFILSLCTTIRPKIRVLINLFYLYTTIPPKLGVSLTLRFILFLIGKSTKGEDNLVTVMVGSLITWIGVVTIS